MGEDADGAGLLVWSPSDSRLQTDKKWKLKHRIQTNYKGEGEASSREVGRGNFPSPESLQGGRRLPGAT